MSDPSSKPKFKLAFASKSGGPPPVKRQALSQSSLAPTLAESVVENEHIVKLSSVSAKDLLAMQEIQDGHRKKEVVIPLASSGPSFIDKIALSIKEREASPCEESENNEPSEQNNDPTDHQQDTVAEISISANSVPSIIPSETSTTPADTIVPDADEDDYEKVSIEDFGYAMLRGMGWNPDSGVGKSQVKVAPVAIPTGQVGRLGLGASPDLAQLKFDLGLNKKRPGSNNAQNGTILSEKEAEQFVAQSKSSVQFEQPQMVQAKKIDESSWESRLIKLHTTKLEMNSLVEVKVSPHLGSFGRVVKLHEKPFDKYASGPRNTDSAESTISPIQSVDVKLNIGDTIVSCLSITEIEVLDENALPMDHPALLDYDYRATSAEPLRPLGYVPPSDVLDVESSVPILEGFQKDDQSQEMDTKPAASRDVSYPKLTLNSITGWRWAHHGLRVRIVSNSAAGDKFYRKKGVIQRISDRSGYCYLKMDDSGITVDFPKEKYIETVIPSVGGLVAVLRGTHKGMIGVLQSKSMDTCLGVVDLGQGQKIEKIDFDDICEWVEK